MTFLGVASYECGMRSSAGHRNTRTPAGVLEASGWMSSSKAPNRCMGGLRSTSAVYVAPFGQHRPSAQSLRYGTIAARGLRDGFNLARILSHGTAQRVGGLACKTPPSGVQCGSCSDPLCFALPGPNPDERSAAGCLGRLRGSQNAGHQMPLLAA